MRSPHVQFTVRRMMALAGAIAFMTVAISSVLGQPPANEGIEQIERRIRRQREENLLAVHALIDRLSARLREQRAGLALDESRLRTVGGFVLDPDQELLALEEQLEGQFSGAPPRPSADAPHQNRVQSRPPESETHGPGLRLPPLPSEESSPFNLDRAGQSNPDRIAEEMKLLKQVRERRTEVRGIIRDLLRARVLLGNIGDDSAPPAPIVAPRKMPRPSSSKRDE